MIGLKTGYSTFIHSTNIYLLRDFGRLKYTQDQDTPSFQRTKGALAGVAPWIECRFVKQRVAGSIRSQGRCLDCRPDSPGPGAWEATTH